MNPVLQYLNGLVATLHKRSISKTISIRNDTLWDLNNLFLEAFTFEDPQKFSTIMKTIESYLNDPQVKNIAEFYIHNLKVVSEEFPAFAEKFSEFQDFTQLQQPVDFDSLSEDELREKLYSLLFPEGSNLLYKEQFKNITQQLRERRMVKIVALNKQPITNPAKEILFTSNILITKPLSDNNDLSNELKAELSKIAHEPQKYWYDHPIPLGVEFEKNEAIYGIRGLETMLKYEIDQGRMDPNDKLSCILSVSTTHTGLQQIVNRYLEEEFRKIPKIKFLDVYVFTEMHTQKILNDILIPLVKKYFPKRDFQDLYEVFGVDGEYGRHYSFLKAISALWQIMLNTKHRATFKIDLDQVFPQEELVKDAGESAFEHFYTPLWGATGLDYWNNTVDLSMIAGALVNESDIYKSIFTPDVTLPERKLSPEEYIFHSKLPQALSTKAEMMTRYLPNSAIDGHSNIIQRIHVTGGTNGILIRALRKYRPFTMSVFGRAEDQAYIFSVLLENEHHLRYLHKPGLIMRHDKKSFAGDAIKAASMGKLIGDYIRILIFSKFAQVLPWSIKDIKTQVDPFTGCFITKTPNTIIMLRFAFKILDLYINGEQEKAVEFAQAGSVRILNIIKDLNALENLYKNEKNAWHLYYDILDSFEADRDLEYKESIRNRFRDICSTTKINFT